MINLLINFLVEIHGRIPISRCVLESSTQNYHVEFYLIGLDRHIDSASDGQFNCYNQANRNRLNNFQCTEQQESEVDPSSAGDSFSHYMQEEFFGNYNNDIEVVCCCN